MFLAFSHPVMKSHTDKSYRGIIESARLIYITAWWVLVIVLLQVCVFVLQHIRMEQSVVKL